MKKISIFKVFMMAAISVFALTFASCDDNDEPENTLKLNPTKVLLAPKGTATVAIENGTAAFTANSSNEKVATATVTDKTITITGVAEGYAMVKVMDKNSQMGQVAVTVKEPLTVNKTSVEVEVGKTASITVQKGAAPYKATTADSKIATASVKDSNITITGVKAGNTIVTVTDKNNRTATVTVTVK